VEKHFGGWTGSGAPLPPPAAPPPAMSRRMLLVDKPGAPQSSLAIGQPGVPRSSPDHVPLEVMNNVLGGLFSSRINLNLREQHGYSYGASSGFSFRRGPGPFSVDASVRADATADAVSEVFREFDRMRNEPVTPAELSLAKDSWQRSLAGFFETSAQSVSSIAQLYMYGLPPDYYVSLPAHIASIDTEQVQRVARQYLDPAHMTVVVVGDRRKVEPGLAALKLGKVEQRDNEGNPAR
jgi:zinc protease